MNSDEKRPAGATSPDPEVVADLIRNAGRRAAPPEIAYQQALDAATNAWRLKVEQMQRRRRYLQIATGLAAGIATLAVLFAILPRDERTPTVRVAALERIIGTLELRPTTHDDWQLLHDDSAVLRAGARLRTGEEDELRVERIEVDAAPVAKRFHARAKGRGNRIVKRLSHIKIIVADKAR